MQRFLSMLALGGILWLLGGCGGGASSSPTPGGNNTEVSKLGMPIGVQGSRESSVVPNKLSVRSGASDADLRATLSKFGYSLEQRHGDFATVRVPGGNLEQAAALLNKEFTVMSAEPINVISTPRSLISGAALPRPAAGQLSRGASSMPFDPMITDAFVGLAVDGAGAPVLRFQAGQNQATGTMGFVGAWDLAQNGTVGAIPVKIAIIDAGFADYSVAAENEDIDIASIDQANSGSVDGAGAFTAGLAASKWTVAEITTGRGVELRPIREMGGRLFTQLAARWSTFTPQVFDLDGGGVLDADDVWNEGTAGVCPNATYVLIKTGTQSGTSWTFSDNEIAAAIDHAVNTADADIVLLGMFGQAAVGANISAAISDARTKDCLVIAPAGDIIETLDTGTFPGDPVDITVTSISPASDPNCVSVACSGFGRLPQATLPDVTIDDGVNPPFDVPNNATGWYPSELIFTKVLVTSNIAVAPYSNFGATIEACGFAIPSTFHSLFTSGGGVAGDPFIPQVGADYLLSVSHLNTANAAAYVAGAAAMVYQALAVANGGTFPADVDTQALDILTQTSDFAPASRIDKAFVETPNALANGAGLLNANKAMAQAITGGTLFQDPMAFTQVQLNQPLTAITQGTDVQLTANVTNGTGPFTLTVDWGDGDGPQVTNAWVPGTIVTLTGGYDKLGPKALTVTVEDSQNQTILASSELFVINPLTASIIVTEQGGGQVALASLDAAQSYIFEVRPSNLYTGTFDDDGNPATAEVPNTTTFQWDFDNSGGAPDATGTAPVFAYPTPGTYTIKLTASEDFRPDQTFNIQVTVQ